MNASQAVTGRPASASVPTQTLQLVGRNIKIPIRSAPNAQGVVTKYLYPGDTVEVKITDSKGFYRLADGSVSRSVIRVKLIFLAFCLYLLLLNMMMIGLYQ